MFGGWNVTRQPLGGINLARGQAHYASFRPAPHTSALSGIGLARSGASLAGFRPAPTHATLSCTYLSLGVGLPRDAWSNAALTAREGAVSTILFWSA